MVNVLVFSTVIKKALAGSTPWWFPGAGVEGYGRRARERMGPEETGVPFLLPTLTPARLL